jgi:hypothetical protein
MRLPQQHHRKTQALAASALLLLSAGTSYAADHQEAPRASARLAADIGDFYAWHENDQLNLALTFGTFSSPGMGASYDANLLYTIHFDTSETADGVSDAQIYVRFAQDEQGAWGMRVSDSQDATLIQGAVETVLTNEQVSAWSGLADDPFFFDQTGFVTTVSTGTISFDPNRDDVAGLNITAIVLQMPVASITANGGSLQTWATTGSL